MKPFYSNEPHCCPRLTCGVDVFTVKVEFLKQVLIKPALSFTAEHRALHNVVAVVKRSMNVQREVDLQYLFRRYVLIYTQ